MDDTFGVVSISMSLNTGIEVLAVAGVFQPVWTVDENNCLVELVLLVEFIEKAVCESVARHQFKHIMK